MRTKVLGLTEVIKMARWLTVGMILTMGASSALAAPMFPVIVDHDFSFLGGRALNAPDTIPYYSWNGVEPDTLIIPKGSYDDGVAENEVFAYTSPVIPKGPSFPVFEMAPDGFFGGDLYLDIQFTASDYAGGDLDVSLVGTGNNDQGNDLEIWGTVSLSADPNDTYTGLLFAMEIEQASLYGMQFGQNYTVEAVGTITTSLLPGMNVGDPGAVTGSMFNPSIPLFLPTGYDPVSQDYASNVDVEIAYSGEAGSQVPEPATLAVITLGGLVACIRRRR